MRHCRISLIALFVSVACVSNAQLLYPSYSDSNLQSNLLEMDGILDLQGTSLKREFTHTLIFGGFIDNEMKARSFEKHGAANRFGVNANMEIRYIHGRGGFMKRDSVAWMVKGGYTAIGNINYTQDLFGLVFFGNESYLDATAKFSGSRLDVMRFQKIGFGIVNKKDKSSITLNLVNVQDYIHSYVRKGELTANEDGSELELDLNGDLRSTTGGSFSKGVGLSIDVDYRMRVKWAKKSYTTFQVSAQNIGLAYMHAGMTQYTANSVYAYSGFQFEQFADGKDPFGKDFTLLDSLGIGKDRVKRLVALPGYIQVAKLVDPTSPKKLQSFFGLRLYPTFSSVPQAFAGVYWKTADKIHLSGAVTYGGFGNVRGGLYVTFNFDRFNWMVGTEDVFGSVSKAGYGESFATRLIWKLN